MNIGTIKPGLYWFRWCSKCKIACRTIGHHNDYSKKVGVRCGGKDGLSFNHNMWRLASRRCDCTSYDSAIWTAREFDLEETRKIMDVYMPYAQSLGFKDFLIKLYGKKIWEYHEPIF
jgi:hypothetical protein